MYRTPHYFGCALFVLFLCFALTVAFYYFYLNIHLIPGPQLLPDQVMINSSQLPHSTPWQIGADTTVRDDDIRGIWMHDAASHERYFENQQGGSVREYVIKYADIDHAKEQYSSLLRDEFQDGSVFTYKDLSGISALNLKADQYRIACEDIYQSQTIVEVDCKGLFRYNTYMILIYTWPIYDSSTTLSSADLTTIFKAVDNNKDYYR